MSFDSIPKESLTNILLESPEQHIQRWATEPNLQINHHLMTAKKQTTRVNIQVKNKRTRYYYPLGLYIIPANEEKNNNP